MQIQIKIVPVKLNTVRLAYSIDSNTPELIISKELFNNKVAFKNVLASCYRQIIRRNVI